MSERHDWHPALWVAAALLGLQALVALAFGVLELTQVRADQLAIGVGVGVLGLGYGVLLAAAARGVALARRWSRSLAVTTQLLLLLLGWSFRTPPTTWVGVLFAAVALTALVCLLLPASTRAFLKDPPAGGPGAPADPSS